jgi:hypothetical protein
MTEQMSIYRLEHLSVDHFIKDLFQAFTFITYTHQFPKEILQVPTISVVNGKLSEDEFELGNQDTIRIRRWYVNVFANSDTQRDDFAYKILEELRIKGITVYDYNEGFPPSASPSAINHLSVISRSYEPIDVIPKLNEKLYFRGQLLFITQNDKV